MGEQTQACSEKTGSNREKEHESNVGAVGENIVRF